MTMTRPSATEYIKTLSPSAFLPPARKIGFICPRCGNGGGKDGDGVVKNPKDSRYYCFKCGEVAGDIFDLIGAAFNLPDFNSQFGKALEIYNISIDKAPPEKRDTAGNDAAGKSPEKPAPKPSYSPDISDTYLNNCRENASLTDYFAKRGIGKTLVKKFGLGFDPVFCTGGSSCDIWQAVILPTGAGSMEVRNTAVSPDAKEGGKNKYRKVGKTQIFNAAALSGKSPVFVCEGIFDALSVMECGGEAIALGSAANYRLPAKFAETRGIPVPLIISLDNDDTGKAAAEKLAAELAKLHIPHIIGDLSGEFHDPNSRLLSDKKGLAETVARLQAAAAPLTEELSAENSGTLETVNSLANLSAFREQIKRSSSKPLCKTGFATLDKAVNGGLYPALYILGAASSVGKTTFLLQIADFAAKQGRQVLFFSLEQSRFELMAKSVSRESFAHCRENRLNPASALTSLDVSDGGRHSGFDGGKLHLMEQAFSRYEQYAGNLFLYEGKGGMSPEDIAAETKKFHTFLSPPDPPLVLVDYIQILSPGGGKMSDKQAMDRNITSLKQLSRDFSLPLIAVSSFNRMSYSQPVSMEAFKESGAIEYGADILMGLQPAGVGTAGFDITAAKARDPRRTELVILKNRSGEIPPAPLRFEYYSKYNFYLEN
ncbi:MAG: toprim domain-containing protein [Ruminococcus sp.]|nr:toprim domain-containing protein [Ruminococcus sp.]